MPWELVAVALGIATVSAVIGAIVAMAYFAHLMDR